MTLVLDKFLDPVDPRDQVPSYVYEDVDLGGVSWNYRLFWNDRSERWQIDIWTSDLAREIYGLKLVPNYAIAWANIGRNPEGGFIMLLDTGDPDAAEQCTYDGLGNRWKLCWITIDEDAEEDRPWSITVP